MKNLKDRLKKNPITEEEFEDNFRQQYKLVEEELREMEEMFYQYSKDKRKYRLEYFKKGTDMVYIKLKRTVGFLK